MRYIKLFEYYKDPQYKEINYREFIYFRDSHKLEELNEREIEIISNIIPKWMSIESYGDDYYYSGWEGNIETKSVNGSIEINDPFTLQIGKFNDEWFSVVFGMNEDGEIHHIYRCDGDDGLINCLKDGFSNLYEKLPISVAASALHQQWR